MDRREVTREHRGTLRFITSFLNFPIFAEKGPWGGGLVGGGGAGALAILCVLGVCRAQGYVFHNFCVGRVLFSGAIVWQGVCFNPGLILRVASVNKRLARRQ